MRPLCLAAPLAAAFALAVSGAATADPADDLLAAHDVATLTPSPASPRASSKNVRILAHVNPGTGTNADVFGYRQHAYLASWRGRLCLSKGVRTYDLRNPTAPRLVSTFADAASDPAVARTWTEKVIVQHVSTSAFNGDLAVVSFQACFRDDRLNSGVFRGFGLYDVSDPAHPRKLALVNTEPGQNAGSHEIWLQAVGNRAYVYTAIPFSEVRTSPDGVTPGKPDFRIYDVSNPTAPTFLGGWGAWKELGVHPFAGQGGFAASFTHSVIVNEQATRAYLSYWDLGTVILDISEPAHPRFLGRTTFGPDEQGDAHSAAIARGDNLLVETHETDAGVPTFYDISDPANPVRLSEFVPAGFESDTVHDPRLRGSIAAFSWYSLGVVLADVSRPGSPRFVAQFAPAPDYVNPDFFCSTPCREVWGAFIDDNYVLASDMNDGLWVFRVT